jgi:hypothetical protein
MATVTAERRAHANSYGLLLLQRRASRSRHGDAVAVIHGPLGLWGENFFLSLSQQKKPRGARIAAMARRWTHAV